MTFTLRVGKKGDSLSQDLRITSHHAESRQCSSGLSRLQPPSLARRSISRSLHTSDIWASLPSRIRTSVAGQLVKAGKDWKAYLQNIPIAGTTLANWPGDNNTAKLYAVRHNPFPYVAEIQNDAAQFAKQVPIEQLFSDLGSGRVPAFSYIVPDQCRDMHGIGNPLAPCGGAFDTDDNDVKRGDDETGWLVNGIMGSQAWQQGRNAIFIVFEEGNGPLTCAYDPDAGMDTAPGSLLPGADCYAPANFNDKVVLIAITNYGVRGVQDSRFQSHYSLLKTIEAAFGLSYVGPGAAPRAIREPAIRMLAVIRNVTLSAGTA